MILTSIDKDTSVRDDELMHYGVVGMKWGVHRAARKKKANDRLREKSLDYDKKSSKYTKKSEKIHAKKDLETSNVAAKKAANLATKSAKLQKKALSEPNDFKRLALEKRAAKAKYKSATKKMKANRLSRTTGYGVKAMKYSIKSDKFARKAAKARMKIATNEAYIAQMNAKVSAIPASQVQSGRDFVNRAIS